MRPEMLKKHRINISIVLSLLTLSLIAGFLLSFIVGINYNTYVRIATNIVLIDSFILGLSNLASLFLTRYMVSRTPSVFLTFFSSTGIVIGAGVIAFLLIIFINPIALIYTENRTFSYLLINLLFFLTINIVICGFIIFQNRFFKQEKALNEEKFLKSQIELKLLASKINPHFLFNSLNLMVSLLKTPEKAEEALINLSEILRHQLEYTEASIINLKLELRIVEKYLSIQKMRFGEKLNYKIKNNTDGDIPPFIIQPLVENSIKHNIDRQGTLSIYVSVISQDGFFIITIIDSYKKLEAEMLNKGVGLSVTQKRVEAFGGTFSIINGGIEISINHD
jgi:two-component system, LytTR family, sensor kinase